MDLGRDGVHTRLGARRLARDLRLRPHTAPGGDVELAAICVDKLSRGPHLEASRLSEVVNVSPREQLDSGKLAHHHRAFAIR